MWWYFSSKYFLHFEVKPSINILVTAIFDNEIPDRIAAAVGILKGVIVNTDAPPSIHDTEIPVIFKTAFASGHLL